MTRLQPDRLDVLVSDHTFLRHLAVFEIFCRTVASRPGLSKREVQREMGLSNALIGRSLRALEERYGQTLILNPNDRKTRRLTDAGTRLLTRIREALGACPRLLSPTGLDSVTVKLAVDDLVLTHLMPFGWLGDTTGNAGIRFEFLEYDPDRVIAQVREGQIHLAVGPATGVDTTGVEARSFGQPDGGRVVSLPLVAVLYPGNAVARKLAGGRKEAVECADLAGMTWCMMDPVVLPGVVLPPAAPPYADRFHLRSYGAVLGFAQTDVGVGIVPYTPALDDLRQRGLIAYAPLAGAGSVTLAAYLPAAGQEAAIRTPIEELLAGIDAELRSIRTSPSARPRPDPRDFPATLDGYAPLRWAYYVSCARSYGGAQWFEAKLSDWKRDRAGGGVPGWTARLFDSRIEPSGEDVWYTLRARRIADHFLTVFGQSDRKREQQQGVWKPDRFTAVFNTRSADGDRLTGSWTGVDGDQRPTSGPMLFSRDPLTPDQIREIVRDAPWQFFPGAGVISWEGTRPRRKRQ